MMSVLSKVGAIGITRAKDIARGASRTDAGRQAFRAQRNEAYQRGQSCVDAGELVTLFVEGQRTQNDTTVVNPKTLALLAGISPEDAIRVVPMRIEYSTSTQTPRPSVRVRAYGPYTVGAGNMLQRKEMLLEIVENHVVSPLQ